MEISNGLGRHEYYLGPQEKIVLVKYNVLATVVLVLSTLFSKTSICLLLLRLLGDAAAKKRKYFLYILIWILFTYNVVDIISLLIQCKPTTKIWNREIEGTCWNPSIQESFALMQGGLFDQSALSRCPYTDPYAAFSVFSAFVLSIYPVLILKDLQLNRRTKIALCVLLGVGIL